MFDYTSRPVSVAHKTKISNFIGPWTQPKNIIRFYWPLINHGILRFAICYAIVYFIAIVVRTNVLVYLRNKVFT
jgi:hypothetical protein